MEELEINKGRVTGGTRRATNTNTGARYGKHNTKGENTMQARCEHSASQIKVISVKAEFNGGEVFYPLDAV